MGKQKGLNLNALKKKIHTLESTKQKGNTWAHMSNNPNGIKTVCALVHIHEWLLNTRPPSLHKHSALPAVQQPLGFVSSSGF